MDEWVASAEERTERERGVVGAAHRALDRVPDPARLAVVVGLAALLPFVLGSGDLFRFGLFTVLYALLALGLNVAVGFAGLLDLGYIAFYGFGAYTYAILASPKYDWHLDTAIVIPIVVVLSALLGLLLGLPSRRLLGDYLAIVTLFFGQAFVTFVNSANPGGITGGANGLADIDPFEFFGWELGHSTREYFWFSLGALVVVAAALWSLSRSRIGRVVARPPRGPAGGGADGDAGQPAQAARLLARRRDRRADRVHLRRRRDGRRGRRLRRLAPDHSSTRS